MSKYTIAEQNDVVNQAFLEYYSGDIRSLYGIFVTIYALCNVAIKKEKPFSIQDALLKLSQKSSDCIVYSISTDTQITASKEWVEIIAEITILRNDIESETSIPLLLEKYASTKSLSAPIYIFDTFIKAFRSCAEHYETLASNINAVESNIEESTLLIFERAIFWNNALNNLFLLREAIIMTKNL